jgi:heme a synthase
MLARFAWLVLFYNVAVVLWGALVRATGSGAGCGSHWPLCNGEVLPRAPAVETLIEFSHRASSGLALILVIALLVWTWRARPKRDPSRAGALASLVLILVEAGVGAGLVLLELVAGDTSPARAVWMAAHLLNTFALLAALALTAHWLSGGPALRLRGRGTGAAILAGALASVALVGVSGAVAALGDTLFPAESLTAALRVDLAPTAHLLLRLRLLHPVLAILGAVVVVAATILAPLPLGNPKVMRLARGVSGLVLFQLGVGALNVALLAPVWVQILHLLVADLVWIGLVLLAAHGLAAPAPDQRAAITPEPAPSAGF